MTPATPFPTQVYPLSQTWKKFTAPHLSAGDLGPAAGVGARAIQTPLISPVQTYPLSQLLSKPHLSAGDLGPAAGVGRGGPTKTEVGLGDAPPPNPEGSVGLG